MKQSKGKIFFICVFLITFIFLAACKSDDQDEEAVNLNNDNNEDIIEEVEEEEEENEEPKVRYPLTGLAVEDEQVDLNARPFGVMIENSSSARPQSGLIGADMVYEVLSEGNITRFLALFHSQQPERIGPVRSARQYYIHLNNGYDAVYFHAGGSPGAFYLADKGEVDSVSALTYDGVYFTRSSDRKAPHNLYTSYDNLVKATEAVGYDTVWSPPDLYFEDALSLAASSGQEVDEIEINYGSSNNNVKYVYDSNTKHYIRYNGGVVAEDLETGQAIAPKNIFIVEAFHRVIPAGENHIDAGEHRREVDVTSGGRAYLLQEGILQEVEWKNVGGQIIPIKNGKEVALLPGQTWINFVPDTLDSKVSFPGEES